MSKILKIYAREILDSRATPTVEAVCVLNTGQVVVSSVPSGASTGSHEVLELRDNDPKRYKGKGVLNAITNVNQVLGPSVVSMDPMEQEKIDKKLIELDGTENKSKMGANAMLAVSEVVTKAAAASVTTSETANIALAPIFDLFSVPSSSINFLSIFSCSIGSILTTDGPST